jgi:hypothetical protein
MKKGINELIKKVREVLNQDLDEHYTLDHIVAQFNEDTTVEAAKAALAAFHGDVDTDRALRLEDAFTAFDNL